jgi:hypothetical protein
MKRFICFLVKALVAFSIGLVAACFSDKISAYHFADVTIFFAVGLTAFYMIDGFTKKISRV